MKNKRPEVEWIETAIEKPPEFEKVLIWPLEVTASWIEEFYDKVENKTVPSGFYEDRDIEPIPESDCVFWSYLPLGPK